MMLCPKCKDPEMRFEVHMRISSIVWIECTKDGDYLEKQEDRRDCDWTRVECSACCLLIDEQDARDCFDDQPDHWSSENGCHEDCPACAEEVEAELKRREP